MPAGQQRGQRGGLRADPDRAARTQHHCEHRIGSRPRLGGCSASPGPGLGDGRLPGTGLVRGISLLRGTGGGTLHGTARVHRAGYIGGGGVADMPTPATTPRHQLVLGDLRWWRRIHIHHLATDPRGLSGIVQRLRTAGTPIRGHLERLIRILNHTARRRRRTRLLPRFPTRPAACRPLPRRLLVPRRIRRRGT